MNVQVDARPFRPSSQSTWDQAVEDRKRIETVLRETLRAEGVEAAVIPSEDGIYPPWVRVQAWMADGTAPSKPTLRSLVDFSVAAKPYHRVPVVRTMRLTRGPKILELKERPNLSDADVADWTRHAIGRAPRPAYHPWREAFFSGANAPHKNRLKERFRPAGFKAKSIVTASAFVCGFLAVQIATQRDGGVPGFILGAFAVVLFVVSLFMGRSRVEATVAPSQPKATPPRRLISVDEWHGVATGLAEHSGNFETYVGRAIEKAAAAAEIGMAYAVETVHHVTPNGYEVRPRHVLKRGQAEVHLDVYGFGNDLFVGWNAYLNWLQWSEGAPVSARRMGAVTTNFVDLEPGFYVPNQLDLIDLSCLTEVLHRCVKKQLEALVKAANVDQQVDFEIFRGDREKALDRRRHGTNEKEREEGAGRGMKGSVAGQSIADTQFSRAALTTAPSEVPPRRSSLGAIVSVVAIWIVTTLALRAFVGVNPLYNYPSPWFPPFPYFGFLLEAFALAVGARLFARISIAEAAAIWLASGALAFAFYYAAGATFDWMLYHYYIYGSDLRVQSMRVLVLTNILALLTPLMFRLPVYRRPVVILSCCIVAFISAYAMSYAINEFRLYYDSWKSALVGMMRGACVLAVIAYWLPRDRGARS